MSLRTLSAATLILGMLAPVGAQAEIIPATSRGSYCDATFAFCTGGAGQSAGNHLTGIFNSSSGSSEYRSFFIFDLSFVSGTVTGASMFFEFSPSYPGFISSDASETLKLFSVDSTTAAALSSGTAGAAGFADLGAGTEYASFTSAPGGLLNLTMTFNAAGLAAADASVGDIFMIGGALSSLGGPADQFIFGDSLNRVAYLTLDVQAVPEPASLALLGLGLAGLGFSRRNGQSR